MDARTALEQALAPAGLDPIGVVSVDAWDAAMPDSRRSAALLPGARSILVVASGGRRLWDAFLDDLRREPAHLASEPHPLDAFVRRAVAAADPVLGSSRRRWFFAAADAEVHLDFRLLGHLAGLGGRSRLGLLLHPVHGLWLGMRAAVLVQDEVRPDAPEDGDPCAGCPAPCLAACPGDAFPGGAWDVDRCSAFHHASEACRDRCHARLACPRGAPSRYSEAQLTYHYDRPGSRPRLAAMIGLDPAEDRYPGEPVRWGDWRARVDVRGKPAP